MFMAALTAVVENGALNMSTGTFAVVATEATLRDEDTTTATSATFSDSTTPTSTTSTASSDINLSSDGSTDSDERVFSGFALHAIIGAGAVMITLVVGVFAINRARPTARRDQGTKRSAPPDNSGWNSNTNNVLSTSTEWRSEVRADPPDNKPPANFKSMFRRGDENHTGPITRQETERERPRPVAAPRPTSVVECMTQSAQQASDTDQVLYATTDDAPGDTLFLRPTGVVPHNTPSPVPVLRLQPASFGLSEDETSIKMASISRTNPLNLHAGFAAMDAMTMTMTLTLTLTMTMTMTMTMVLRCQIRHSARRGAPTPARLRKTSASPSSTTSTKLDPATPGTGSADRVPKSEPKQVRP